MAANASEQTPRIATASFPGPRHIKAGVVRQDAAAGRAEQRRAVIAVADGHGDPNCRYSDWGAVVASRVAVEVLWQFIGGDEEKVQCRTPGLAPTSEEITQAVRRIAYLWRVRTAQLSQLFDQWEISQRIDGLAIGGGSAGAEAAAKSALFDEQALDQIVAAGPDDNRSHLFGTTLLAAAIWKKHLLLLKIGDGEIILSHAAGEPERWGERSQEKNYSNRTDSLSGNAERFETELFTLGSAEDRQAAVTRGCRTINPRFIALLTDGVSDAYERQNERDRREGRSEEVARVFGQRNVPPDSSDGWSAWCSEVTSAIAKLSQVSGDDATIAAMHLESACWWSLGGESEASAAGISPPVDSGGQPGSNACSR